VVFRRRDKASGETRYIYHGNDGTSFPWNDTAQLDYLNAAVREQVIQTILHVARLFPVIRFDAAMTLAKRHFHRLWFPGPGSSGAIPSRAEYGMSQADFDRAMPQEFWREVVDRVAAEVPGTLLLAEAFWLMEGYFVRTLGMHRVYNSAFMIMLRDEDNAKYRSVIKNTLEFDPDIMKRYVNFMSNPDERTAIDQFGKGDKCFGVAAMMSTLPGLPMFGHGQIEGFTEKYGMEYRWPRYEENPDHALVQRHEREIAPLLKRRWLFAESNNFLLYDFFGANGTVNEDVFAYSNRNGGERALIVYNNRYADANGTVDMSAAYADKGSGGLRRRRLAEGLGLSGNYGAVVAWRDSLTGLEYLRRAEDLLNRGLTLSLHAYQCHVFLDWHELHPSAEQPWDRLADLLNGRGVPNLADELVNLELKPVHDALRQFLDPAVVRHFADIAEHPRAAVGAVRAKKIERLRNEFLKQAFAKYEKFQAEAAAAYTMRRKAENLVSLSTGATATAAEAAKFTRLLRDAMRMPQVEAQFPEPWTAAARRMLPSPSPQFTATAMWGPVLAWGALQLLAGFVGKDQPELTALDLFDRLRLREPFARALAALGFEGEEAWRVAARIKVLLLVTAGIGKEAVPAPAAEVKPNPIAGAKVAADDAVGADAKAAAVDAKAAAIDSKEAPAASIAAKPAIAAKFVPASSPAYAEKLAIAPALWLDPDVRWLCGVHRAEGHDYLICEHYEELLWWLLMPSLLKIAGEAAPSRAEVEALSKAVDAALATAKAANYRVDATPARSHAALADKLPNVAPADSKSNSAPAGKKPNPAPAKTQAKNPVPPPTKKPQKKPSRKPKK
jgi:hypothetical protein